MGIGKKITLNLIRPILPAGLFIIFLLHSAPAYVIHQPAEVVIGQPNMDSSSSDTNNQALNRPYGIFSNGTQLFVMDSVNHRVLVYNGIPKANYAPADFVIGQPNMTSKIINNGGIGNNSLNYPYNAWGNETHLFIADTSNHRILIYDQLPITDPASANFVIGAEEMTSSTSYTPNANSQTLCFPYGVSGDEIGNLFVADTGNHRVLIYNHIPGSNHAGADFVVGQLNDTSNTLYNDGWTATANTLDAPYGVCSSGGRLFIADTNNNRVLIYKGIPKANYAPADFVIGQPDMTSKSNSADAQSLYLPTSVCCDGTRLFVLDSGNSRLLIYNNINFLQANHASADVVIGQPDMISHSINNGGIHDNSLNLSTPYGGVYTDGIRIFVGDYNNNRVLIYYPSQVPAVSPSYGMSGKTTKIISSGFCDIPVAKLTRPGSQDITSSNAAQYNPYNYAYTFDLAKAAPNCYDITVTASTFPRSLKQAFTVLSPLAGPLDWKVADLGLAGTRASVTPPCGMDIGDADRNNSQELYVANQDLTLYKFWLNAQTWNASALVAPAGAHLGQVLLADGNGDGAWEVYGAAADNNHPFQFQYASGWQKTDMGAGFSSATMISALAKADLDHDGVAEIYAAASDGGHNSCLSQFKYSAPKWLEADPPGSPANPVMALAAGDGDNDTNLELYSAHNDGSVYQYRLNGKTWQVNLVRTGPEIMSGLAVGDGENDGQNEVYAAGKNGNVYQYRWDAGTLAWKQQIIGQVNRHALYAVAVSDCESIGANQVYAACGNGHVYEFKYQAGNWTTLDLGNAGTPLYAMAIGDADNDHHFEVYALGQNNHVYQFKAFTQATPTASPTPTTSPTPLPLFPQGGYAWPNPFLPELGKITHFVFSLGNDAEPFQIHIYNLRGQLLRTLNNTKEWDGRSENGRMCEGGVYIYQIEAEGKRVNGQVVLIK